jgi:hypothetical protein
MFHTTLFNHLGDITIAWDESDQEEMVALISKMMEQGVVFFEVEDNRPVKVLNNAHEAKNELSVLDETFGRMVDAGIIKQAKNSSNEDGEVRTKGIISSPNEAVNKNTIGFKPAAGG